MTFNNVSDILAAPARILYAPVGEAHPSETTIQYGAAWGGNWKDLGETLTPISLGFNNETFDIEVEGSTLPIKRLRTKEEALIETTLAEASADALGLSFGSTVTISPPSATKRGYQELFAGGDVTVKEWAFGIESLYVGANNVKFPIRMFIWRATAVINGKLEFSKKAATGIPLKIQTLGDLSKPVGQQLMKLVKVTTEKI